MRDRPRRPSELVWGRVPARRHLGDRLGQARALDELGLVQQLTGDYPAATASAAEAIKLFRDLGSRHDLAMALNSLGELSLRTSALREARSHHGEALVIAREAGAPLEEARALEGIAAAFSARTLPTPPRTSGTPWRSIRTSGPPKPGACSTRQPWQRDPAPRVMTCVTWPSVRILAAARRA